MKQLKIILLLTAVLTASTAFCQTYTRTMATEIQRAIDPANSSNGYTPVTGWAPVVVGYTQPSTDTYYFNRAISGSAMSESYLGSLFISSTDFETASTYNSLPYNVHDVVFYKVTDLNGPTFTICRQLALSSDVTFGQILTNNIRSFAVGSINQFGRAAFRYDGNSGGYTGGNSIGLKDFECGGPTTVFGNTPVVPFSGASGFTYITGSTSTTNIPPPCLGQNTNTWLSYKWDKTYVGGTNTYNVTVPTVTPDDFRGNLTYNSKAGIAATIWKSSTDSTTYGNDSYPHLVIYPITNNDPAAPTAGARIILNTVVDSNNDGSVEVCYPINYFSGSGYNGPGQIAINDNGDIAVSVVFTTGGTGFINDAIIPATGSSDANTTRQAAHRGVIFAKKTGANTWGPWQIVADAAAPGCPFITFDLLSGTFYTIGNPMLDNYGGVYFVGTAAVQLATGAIDKNALFKATPNSYPTTTSWTLEKVLQTEDYWISPEDLDGDGIGNDKVTVTNIPCSQSGSTNYQAGPSTAGPQNIDRVLLPGRAPEGNFTVGHLSFNVFVNINDEMRPAPSTSRKTRGASVLLTPYSPQTGVTVNGTVKDANTNAQNCDAQLVGRSYTWKVLSTGENGTGTVGTGGAISFVTTTTGTSSVCIKVNGALSVKLLNVTLSGAVNVGDISVSLPDINNDDVWDDFDLNEINGGFGNIVAPGTGADYNCDGMYDDFDLNQINGGFGSTGECFGL